jgi:hypothetical protein
MVINILKMTTTIDIVKIFDENPITSFSGDYQSSLISRIKERFTTKEQQLFIGSFYCYLNYDSHKDFVIELDKAQKWIGFSRKDGAKKLLENNFTKDVDYKIENFAPTNGGAKNDPRGGSNKETVKLTVHCFKMLCLRARTDKAFEIHGYYIKLEEIVHEVAAEESEILRNQLLVKDNQLLLAERKSSTLENELVKITRKRVIGKPKGEYVYILQLREKPQEEYKVGCSKNITKRQLDHLCSNSLGIIYYVNCKNSALTEKVIHHMLDKYRAIHNKEWFVKCEYEVIKQAMDSVCCFMDDFVQHSDLFPTIQFSQKIKDIKDLVPKEPVQIVTPESEPEEEEEESDPVPEYIIPKIKNHLDFEQFILDSCTIGPGKFCIKKELYGKYKLWARCNNPSLKEEVRLYFEEKFAVEKKYIKDVEATLSVYKGIELIPSVYIPSSPPTEIDLFIQEKCALGPIFRSSSAVIRNEYFKWANIPLNDIESSNLHKHFSNYFFPNNSYLGKEGSKIGYWGVRLKTDKSNLGLKISKVLKKKVICINIKTGKIELEFNSQDTAAKYFDKESSSISLDINYKRVRKGKEGSYLLYHERDLKKQNTEEDLYKAHTEIKNTKSIKVYEYKNNQFIKEYKSASAAARENGLVISTFKKKYLRPGLELNSIKWTTTRIMTCDEI